MQWLSSTWNMWSKEVYGYVRTMTPSRERYVAYKMIGKWLDAGYDAGDVAQMWNTGRAGHCIKGINKHGVSYDSCVYEQKVLAYLR